jgi:hypothetical protein
MQRLRQKQKRALMLALIPIVVLTAACSSSGSTAMTQAPTPPTVSQAVTTIRPAAAPQDFVSKRYGFGVTLPKGWSGQDASVAWNGKELEGLDSPAFADFAAPATGRNLIVAAVPVMKGMRLATWGAAMVRATPSVCTTSLVAEKTKLGGEPALAWTEKCSDGYEPIKIAALHRNHGYVFLLASITSNNNAVDRRIFGSIRQSFRFKG